MQKKSLDKIQHPSVIKTLNNMYMEGTYVNIMRAIYNKAIANIILKVNS